jgi:hypothetical protein
MTGKPWRVVYYPQNTTSGTEIAAYRRRTEAEDHAAMLERKQMGKCAIVWSRARRLLAQALPEDERGSGR